MAMRRLDSAQPHLARRSPRLLLLLLLLLLLPLPLLLQLLAQQLSTPINNNIRHLLMTECSRSRQALHDNLLEARRQAFSTPVYGRNHLQ